MRVYVAGNLISLIFSWSGYQTDRLVASYDTPMLSLYDTLLADYELFCSRHLRHNEYPNEMPNIDIRFL